MSVPAGKLLGRGAVQVIQKHVAVGVVIGVVVTGAVLEQDMAFHAQLGGEGGGLAAMVGLGRALGHDHVGALRLGLGHEEFQLAGLVAAGGKAGAIVALDPEFDPQFFREAGHRLERRGQMSEVQAGETGEMHELFPLFGSGPGSGQVGVVRAGRDNLSGRQDRPAGRV